MPIRIDSSELRPQQENLDGVINPQQEDDQRPRGPVAGSNRPASDISADERFSGGEQDCRNHGTDDHITPFEMPVGQDLIDGGKENRNEHEGNDAVQPVGWVSAARASSLLPARLSRA